MTLQLAVPNGNIQQCDVLTLRAYADSLETDTRRTLHALLDTWEVTNDVTYEAQEYREKFEGVQDDFKEAIEALQETLVTFAGLNTALKDADFAEEFHEAVSLLRDTVKGFEKRLLTTKHL